MTWLSSIRRKIKAGTETTPVPPRGAATSVLIATSTGGYPHALALDGVLASALQERGAAPHVLLCDGVLPACQMSKLGRVTAEQLATTGQVSYCARCFGKGQSHFAGRAPLLGYSDLLGPDERDAAAKLAREIPFDAIRSYRYRDLPAGEHAYAGALRFFARGDLEGEEHGEAILRKYLEAALLTIIAFDHLLDRQPFDVVVAHHGIYVPQGMVVEVARHRGIRVVTWNPAYRKHSFIFSHGDTYHHTMISEPTHHWDCLELTPALREHTLAYLYSRRSGAHDWIWFHDQPLEDASGVLRELGVRPDRPYVLLLTSVVWDAQLHYASNAFPSLLEWLKTTISYFGRRPDLQLIVRVHPAEIRGFIPSRQRVADEIRRWFPRLPANVFVVGPDHQASTYALADHANAILIYNTKTGVEVAAQGRPVIVAGEAWIRGKGFSIDVSDPRHYTEVLDRLPLCEGLSPQQLDRAIRYAYHFFFRRMIPLPFIEQDGAATFRVTATPDQLRPGAFVGLDVICDGILTGSPFIYPSERLPDPTFERRDRPPVQELSRGSR